MGFASDIKPLFRDKDRDNMLFAFDLWDHGAVSENSDGILEQLESGDMPCDGEWPQDRIQTFKSWIDAGKPA